MKKDPAIHDLIHSWQERRFRKIQTDQSAMHKKIFREFGKISKENLLAKAIVQTYHMVLFDAPNRPLYMHEVYPPLGPQRDSHLSTHMPGFYEEAMVINEDGFNLMTYLEYLLNAEDGPFLYWVSYPQIGHDVIEEADTYAFTLIQYDKTMYEDLFFLNGALHPFIKSLNLVWSAQFKDKNYDGCFRKAAATMNDLTSTCWDSINILSSLKYEGDSNSGGLLFIERHTAHMSITLASPIPLSQHRTIRKLLQMSKKGHYLLINSDNIAIGFGNIISLDPVFRVEFLDHLSWRLFLGDQAFLSLTNLTPLLPNADNDIKKLKAKLAHTFKDGAYNANRIIAIIQAAKKQSKGTMVVVSAQAPSEAKRLGSSAILITPAQFTLSQVHLVTSIDGALILDPEGICHGIGAILDGHATDNGDPSRGARYNSALRYMNAQTDTACLIVVISEDHYIDILTTGDTPL